MNYFSKIIAFVFIAKTFSASHVAAQDWTERHLHYSLSGNLFPKDMQNIPFETDVIHTNLGHEEPNVAFTCIRGRLHATVAIGKMDFETYFTDMPDTRRTKRFRVIFTRGEKIVDKGNWTYAPKYGFLLSTTQSQAKKLYNAAITREGVQLDVPTKGDIKPVMLKRDHNFAEFGADCGLGVNAKKYTPLPKSSRP